MTELLYGSRALAEWISQGGRPQRAPFAYAARLRWQAYWFELNWRSTATRLEPRPLPPDPVFIVGPWRSGTTALHELIAAAKQWPTPQTWQCFNPSTCFLVNSAPPDAMVARPMDAGIISSRSPQEDEFAALLLGDDSVYRAFIDPRRLPECGARLWGADAAASTASILPRWQTFIRGIATGAEPQRLLLKSPNHTFRMLALRRIFPRAQFIWMGRRSGEVVTSNLKMWRAMMERYALWSCPQGLLEQFVHEALAACVTALVRCIDELSSEQMLWVDFDEFRTQTAQVLRAVMDFLRVDIGAAGQRDERIGRALQNIAVHPGSRLVAPADPAGAQLDALMGSARQRFGASVARRNGNR